MSSADANVDLAVRALGRGGLVVIPTDTVYGLAAIPSLPRAIGAVFEAKGRAPDKPIPVLAPDIHRLEAVVVLDERARRLAERYWPGPLTLVLSRAPSFTYDLGGGAPDSVAVRIPDNEIALQVLAAAGPLAVTSANRSGGSVAVTVEEARAALGAAVDVYVDGGPRATVASTVLSLVAEPVILRDGELDAGELLAAARV